MERWPTFPSVSHHITSAQAGLMRSPRGAPNPPVQVPCQRRPCVALAFAWSIPRALGVRRPAFARVFSLGLPPISPPLPLLFCSRSSPRRPSPPSLSCCPAWSSSWPWPGLWGGVSAVSGAFPWLVAGVACAGPRFAPHPRALGRLTLLCRLRGGRSVGTDRDTHDAGHCARQYVTLLPPLPSHPLPTFSLCWLRSFAFAPFALPRSLPSSPLPGAGGFLG